MEDALGSSVNEAAVKHPEVQQSSVPARFPPYHPGLHTHKETFPSLSGPVRHAAALSKSLFHFTT